MPELITRVPLWVRLDYALRDADLQNFANKRDLEAWRGNSVDFHFGVFDLAGTPASLANFAKITVEMRESDGEASALIAEKVILPGAITPTITAEAFAAYQAAHFVASFTKEETSVAMGSQKVKKVWLVAHALMVGGAEITLGAGWFYIFEDAAGSGGTPPPVPPSTYYTQAEIDGFLALKAASVHTHVLTDLTDSSALGRSLAAAASAAAARTLLALSTVAASGSAADLNGTLAAARLPAFAGGDVTSVAGSATLTLSTVNVNIGTFGSATQAPVFTVDGKGRITGVTVQTITPAWADVTGKPTTVSASGLVDAVATSRSIATSGLATGGGDFSANRTITVPAASDADAIAGMLSNVSMTPAADRAALRSYVDPIAATRQGLLGWGYSDNATPNRRQEWAMGSAGNVAGSPLSETGFVYRVPTGNPSVAVHLLIYASTNTSASFASLGVVQALYISLGTTGDLVIRQVGALFSDYREFRYIGFRAAYSGRLLRIDFTLPGGTSTPSVYFDGVDASSAFTSSTSGTAPNWMSASMVATYRLCGYNIGSDEFRAGNPINRALSAAEIFRIVQRNKDEAVDRMGGSQVNQSTVAFTDSLGVITSFSSVDGSGWSGDTPAAAFRVQAVTAPIGVVAGRAYRVRFTATNPVSLGVLLREGTSTSASNTANVIEGPNEHILVATLSGGLRLTFVSTAGSQPAGPGVIISGLTMVALGALLQPEITRTAQILDQGPNRIRGLMTAGMRPLSDRDPVGIRGNITATGNILGLGASDPLWFETGIIRAIRIKPTANAATTVTYRLNTSGGTVIGTVTTSTLNQWVTLPFAAGTAFEVGPGDKIHITTDAAHDFDIEWSRR